MSKVVCHLQDMPITEAKSDIETYLKDKLPKLTSSPELLDKLGLWAGGLFIYAAMVVRYLTLDDLISSTEQTKMLNNLLSESYEQASASDATFLIDILYQQIMRDTFSTFKGELLTRWLHILYTFLCTAECTSTSTIAALIVDNDNEVTKAIVDKLHAVLYSQDNQVFWYHPSFPDFIFDPAQSGFHIGKAKFEFWCNEPAHHHLLGKSCFHIMKSEKFGLWFKMGDIPSSFLFNRDNSDILSKKVQQNISPILRYSSQIGLTTCHQSLVILFFVTAFQTSFRFMYFSGLRLWTCSKCPVSVLWCFNVHVSGHWRYGLYSLSCTATTNGAGQHGNSYSELVHDIGEAANFATYFTGSPAAELTLHLYISALATWLRETSPSQNWKNWSTCIPVFTHVKGSIDMPLMTISAG